MSTLLGLVLAAIVSTAHAQFRSQCLAALVASGDVSLATSIVREIPNKFDVVDLERGNPDSIGTFRLESLLVDGVLLFDVKTKLDDGRRSEVLHARSLFDEMMRFYEGHVHGIRARWGFGENLRSFNESVRKGASHESAALDTWTGKQAARHGFNQVAFSLIRPEKGPDFSSVIVIFTKRVSSAAR